MTADAPAIDITTRDRIAADALRWAADRIDPGPRATRPDPIDEAHDVTMCANRGTATNLRFWADQIERGHIEPRLAGSAPHVTDPALADVERVAHSLFDADQRRFLAKHAHLPGATPGRWSDMPADTRRLYEDRSRAALDALAAAGRLLPEPTETRTEWGIWWYGPIGDGIRLTQDKFSSRQAAEEHAPTRVGDYGITRYEIRRREHRYFADHSSWSGDWVVAGRD